MKDDRMRIVMEILNPSRETELQVNITTAMSVEDITEAQQKALNKHTQRIFPLNDHLKRLDTNKIGGIDSCHRT